MQFVPASQLTEGMCVAEHVCDHYGRVLITRGQRIGQFHIDRLQKFGIQSLFVEKRGDSEVAAPAKSTLRLQCEAAVSATMPRLAGGPEPPDASAVRRAADGLVQSLMKTRRSVVTLTGSPASDDRATQHAVDVAALAVALGIDFRLPDDKLAEIGSAMLLHDVGMMLLPRELTQRTVPPGPREIRQIRMHTVLGCRFALGAGALTKRAAELVLSHHERLDGSGYPQGLRGDRLSLPARIVAAAEAYCSLASDRCGIPAMLPDAAMAWMLDQSGTLFDRSVVLALSTRIALYPDGSAVRLTTGETGIVAGTLPHESRRPIVLVHTNNNGRPLGYPLIVDLTRETDRSVARCASSVALLQTAHEARAPSPVVDPDLAGIG